MARAERVPGPDRAQGQSPYRRQTDPRRDALIVTLAEGLPLEMALKRLKRAVIASGLFKELHRRGAFVPRASARRVKSLKARRRARREAERAGGGS